jgi:hypothetical protein
MSEHSSVQNIPVCLSIRIIVIWKDERNHLERAGKKLKFSRFRAGNEHIFRAETLLMVPHPP